MRYKQGSSTKGRDQGDHKRPSDKEEMDLVRPCPQNGLPLTLTPCPHLGFRREKEAGSTTRDMEKDSGKRD